MLSINIIQTRWQERCCSSFISLALFTLSRNCLCMLWNILETANTTGSFHGKVDKMHTKQMYEILGNVTKLLQYQLYYFILCKEYSFRSTSIFWNACICV